MDDVCHQFHSWQSVIGNTLLNRCYISRILQMLYLNIYKYCIWIGKTVPYIKSGHLQLGIWCHKYSYNWICPSFPVKLNYWLSNPQLMVANFHCIIKICTYKIGICIGFLIIIQILYCYSLNCNKTKQYLVKFTVKYLITIFSEISNTVAFNKGVPS